MALRAFELHSVTHSFANEKVLSEVSLSAEKGQRIVVVGPSGQGKTTLLKIMAGLLEPEMGRVFIEGQDFHQMNTQAKQGLLCRMGMLFQKNALFDSMTAGENVAFPLREATRLNSEAISQKVKQSLASVGLSAAEYLYPSEMSGGMQKRLGIARAQALEPELLLYDDPTAGLDPITSRKIVDLIGSLQKVQRATIVVVTNEMARAFQIADRIWFVEGKSVLDLGSPEEARQNQDPRVRQFLRGEARGPLLGAV